MIAPPALSVPPCDVRRARIFELVDGELDGWTRARLRDHLQRCAACRHEHAHARALTRAVKRAARIERAPASLRDSLARWSHDHVGAAMAEGASHSTP